MTIALEYPFAAGEVFRGFSVGARFIDPGDPIDRAAQVAATADAAIVVVGTDEYFETEGEDRPTLSLPGDQDALVAAVAAANANTVVVLNSGSPVTMPWLDDVAAVVQLWFPGQELGGALADVLSGDEEPGGRLPVTFPRNLDETPAAPYYPPIDGRSVYGERQLIGYRWFDRTGVEPLFPFGHGLGYTTFTIAPTGITGSPSDGVAVVVDVANTGERSGTEVVQVYVEPIEGDLRRPVRQLAAFRKVRVDPGDTERVEIEVSPTAFRVWRDGGWVPAAEYVSRVGRAVVPRPHRCRHDRGLRFLQPPIDRGQTGLLEGRVGARERLRSEEPVVRREWRRVGRLDDDVPAVEQRPLAPGMAAPEDEHDRVRLGIDGADDLVGERLPALALVRRGGAGANRQRRVEQQDALARP